MTRHVWLCPCSTGDVLHFGLAREQTSVSNPDIPTHLIIVGDDVAVTRSQGSITGRRGLAGTVLVTKVAGAAAASGADFEEVKKVAAYVAGRVGTIGSGLGHCSVPGTKGTGDDNHLGADEIEIGMGKRPASMTKLKRLANENYDVIGIHNEPGIKTIPLPKTRELVRLMLDYITKTDDSERSFLPFKNDGTDEVVLLVNNLGGLGEMEMAAIAGETLDALNERGIKVVRVGAGRYMVRTCVSSRRYMPGQMLTPRVELQTSINLPGFSLTLLLLPRKEDTDTVSTSEIISLLDAPTDAPGWTPVFEPRTLESLIIGDSSDEETLVKNSGNPVSFDYASFERALTAACERVIEAEPEITRYDTIAGDGDCGTWSVAWQRFTSMSCMANERFVLIVLRPVRKRRFDSFDRERSAKTI